MFASLIKISFNPVKRLLMSHQIAVTETRVALAQTNQVNGIQHIRLPHTVKAGQAIQTRREVKILTLIVFEVGKFEPGQKQIRMDSNS